MRVPRATYRVQFNAGFTFEDATKIVPYLAELGISDLYASPYTKARPGSTHGYDVTDYNALNPAIGGEEHYGAMVDTLGEHGMGQLLDIVPNHMGVGSDNGWWLDVLEHGPASRYARFFDIDWYPAGRQWLHGKVLLPVLGDHYRAVLESGELRLAFDPERGSLGVNYYEHHCPLDPKTYPMVLGGLPLTQENERVELEGLITAFGNLPGRGETGEEELVAERARDATVAKGRLARLLAGSPGMARAVEARIGELNGEPGDAESFDGLHRVLESQAYRLAYWRVAGDEINYRRFFAINDLAGLRQEDERVFEETHRMILKFLREGKVQGLRVDHPDGLYDPAGYLRRLQEAAVGATGGEAYVLVEKILAAHERLPEEWPVAGTTGYDFMNLLNGLFVDPEGENGIERSYRRFIGREADFGELLLGCKHMIMHSDLSGELDALSRRLLRISGYGRRRYDFSANALRDALAGVVAHFPVYRTYVTPGHVSEADRRYVERAVARAEKQSTAADTTVYDFIRGVLLLEADGPEEYKQMVARFVMRFQQYTGPVMAKGMEDTALYIYNRLISLNEVGGEPERFGVTPHAFHRLNGERTERWPRAMLATSTHDTKRSEDVRARINVLSEMPGEWRARLARWGHANRSRRREVDGHPAPSRNDEYLLYQTLLGAWPPGEIDEEGLGEFRGRIWAYMQKAMREARSRTSWTKPNEEYEAAVADFVDALLTPSESNLFLGEFLPFQERIARLGALNSLSQTLLKLTIPGVPDIYQGNDLWDFSLVDPDNRRPVDYGLRQGLLEQLKRLDPADAGCLLDGWQDGRSKLYVTWKALQLRRERPELFDRGRYIPLGVSGARADHLVAFARVLGDQAAIVVAPRLVAGLAGDSGLRFRPGAWSETGIQVPGSFSGMRFTNVFTGETIIGGEKLADGVPPAGELLRSFPVALLTTDPDSGDG